jgi:hypothetical protein
MDDSPASSVRISAAHSVGSAVGAIDDARAVGHRRFNPVHAASRANLVWYLGHAHPPDGGLKSLGRGKYIAAFLRIPPSIGAIGFVTPFFAVVVGFAMNTALVINEARRRCPVVAKVSRGPRRLQFWPSFKGRVRRVVAGVFHHISPHHADLYFNEIGFRWSQRVVSGRAVRRTRKGREGVKPLWSRIAPAFQLAAVFRSAVARQLRRTTQGGIQIRCAVAVFG